MAKKTKRPESVKIDCGMCERVTNHEILCKNAKTEYGDEEGSVWLTTENTLVRCKGCENVALVRETTFSEDESESSIQVFPDPSKEIAPLSDHLKLPAILRQIYVETLKALGSDQLILAGIGSRAIIEAVAMERKAAGRNLKDKIDDLVKQGVLTKEGATILHKLRAIGNKSAHEVKPQSHDELSFAIDVINHLLLGVYILPQRAKEI